LNTDTFVALILPAAYHASFAAPSPGGEGPSPDDGTKHGLLLISRGTSIILLILYAAYLNFQLRTHPDLFRHKVRPGEPQEEEELEDKEMNLPAAAIT
jgi:Ca2+:H+ antiporter